MIVQTTSQARSQGLFESIGQTAVRIFTYLAENSANARAAREAQRLWAMSDAELAAMGIARKEILHRTFGPRMWI